MKTISKLFILFIFISSVSFAQSNMFWNAIDIPFHSLITRFGVPDDIEYQQDGSYFMAYHYGNKSVVYVIDKAIVTSILYLEEVEVYNDAKQSFIKWDSVSTEDEFKTVDISVLFFEKIRNNTQLRAKLVENFNSFFIAIEIKKI